MAANSSSSPSLSSSSIPAKDSSQDLQLLPEAATNATVSGTITSPPLGSDISMSQPNATVSGTVTSSPLGSDLSLATTNATVSVTFASPPIGSDLSLATTNATVSGNVTSPPLGSDLSLATTNATVSGTTTSPPIGSDTSLFQHNATVSGTGESPPPGSNLSMSQPNANASGTVRSPPLDRSLVPPPKSQKTEAGSSAGSSLRNLQSRDRERPPTQQALPQTNSPAKQKSPFGIMDDEVKYPPLNLPLTKTPEFLAKIQAILNEYYPCPRKQILPDVTEGTKALTPPESPRSSEKPKPINFPVSRITIGQWTHVAVYPDDLKAKCYFAKKKLMWEILDNEEQVPRLKRKIEIQWADVLSLRKTIHSHDETGTLEVELGKRPTFFMETNPQAGKHTKWIKMDQDFTPDRAASKCRIHTLHFAPGVLQENFEKIVRSDSFWSELVKVNFPVSPPDFDIGL